MVLSNNGYELIKTFEGIKNDAYLDSVSIPTIGIGFTTIHSGPVKMGMTMTDDDIKKEFIRQVSGRVEALNNLLTTKVSQNQFDSLISLIWNIGITAFSKSTLLKLVNINPNDPNISAAFQSWCKAGGRTIPGLLTRRQAEVKNYFKI